PAGDGALAQAVKQRLVRREQAELVVEVDLAELPGIGVDVDGGRHGRQKQLRVAHTGQVAELVHRDALDVESAQVELLLRLGNRIPVKGRQVPLGLRLVEDDVGVDDGAGRVLAGIQAQNRPDVGVQVDVAVLEVQVDGIDRNSAQVGRVDV